MPQTGAGSDELSAWTGRVSKMATGTQAEMEREWCGFWVEADPRRWILELDGATMLRHAAVRYGGAGRCNLLAPVDLCHGHTGTLPPEEKKK